jgi:putative nucleotidyltransferase with HDIG domain
LEISRPDFPLLQFFLRNAPGTYQHSLQVANLAEQAAERIGADALLTRVGALFHDVGKAKNPMYFIENQLPGNLNTHDDLDPLESSKAITQHVLAGIGLARKYRLPQRLDDFILEHHGTMITRYQYSKAVEAAGGDESKVDPEAFRYPGPRPRSRETALLMLADGTEARVRAARPKNEEELREIIKTAIEHVQQSGQLDNTQLTLRDLSIISESFVTTLRGTYHPRIEYPKVENAAAIQNVPTTPREETTP